jgi:sugar phosphate isomerase/epimerase
MRISLFSQSLFALSLNDAIDATAALGYPAIELACKAPHLDLATARSDAERVAERIRKAGLVVSALSGFTSFTDPKNLAAELDAVDTYLGLAPLFGTKLVKLTPGAPASAQATSLHWNCLALAMTALVPMARTLGLRLAFETHMRQLTDTLASSQRLLALTPTDVVGLTLDFSNLAFAGEDLTHAVPSLLGRTLNTHVKNGTVDAQGGWHFAALDQGLTDYAQVLPLLRTAGYDGYLTVECLGPEAAAHPLEVARRDLAILQHLLDG